MCEEVRKNTCLKSSFSLKTTSGGHISKNAKLICRDRNCAPASLSGPRFVFSLEPSEAEAKPQHVVQSHPGAHAAQEILHVFILHLNLVVSRSASAL